ncbi:MAG: TrmH family RNA methyltransferase [Candidatus Campbellbacteria bacterium]|nr:TrmH family RNA methyltransferase [Candidatus Campbellbacteria bacterium]
MNTYVILDNIRSVHNVGSIFRTCDAAGVTKLYLCGLTPIPVDRFGRVRKDMAKVALGAEKNAAWEYAYNTQDVIEKLKQDGVWIVAVEQNPHSKLCTDISVQGPIAFVFGGEVAGISKEILKMCDEIIEIPMRGKKESLNVSVTVGIILFR